MMEAAVIHSAFEAVKNTRQANQREPISSKSAFIIAGMLLLAMAIADWYFSNRLKAEVEQNLMRKPIVFSQPLRHQQFDPHSVSTMMIPTSAESTSIPDDTAHDVDLVAEALNSRYMQWGAVGVMLSLFVWLVTRWAPAQERRRDEERKYQTEAFLASLAKRDELLERRDANFIIELRDIRSSVEQHTRDAIAAKDRLVDEFNDLRISVQSTSK